MKLDALKIGFIPLVDAAPLIVAAEMGLAEEEGLKLTLEKAGTWSLLRDRLCFGHVDAAHMLSPVPVASALGLGGAGAPLHALSVLSVNGNVIGVSRALATAMREGGHGFDFADAHAAGTALIRAKPKGLRIGVPFPFSMHAELVFYWLTALGLPAPQSVDIRTVPPPLMKDALEAGEIDAFCVGEPWGSRSVEAGVGELLLPGAAIWAFAPEKVIAVRADWIAPQQDVARRLIRATWRAARWLAQPGSRALATELLSQEAYLHLAPELLEPALSGQFSISPAGERRLAPGFLEFFDGAAGFPWKSQAEWIARQLAERAKLPPESAAEAGRGTFRSDIYRQALSGVAHDLPSASAKLEGAMVEPTAVGSMGGRLILSRDTFFDGRIFEPSGTH
ncbi:MAG: CmpA/NrtA family ABC transporter substrate-binding protein [Pseudomonadota bacterium]